MKKIKLLLSGKYNIQNYVEALNNLGAVAVTEYLSDFKTDCDGLILCGGSDVDPKYYNEEINGSVNIDSVRDMNEMELLRAFVEEKKPVLGICRGHQLINVFFGGTLYQHLAEADLHTRKDGKDSVHKVKAACGSILETLYGSEFFVNSAHHQAIKDLGDGLRSVATWNDQYIEAIEHKTLPIIGVQWHPERMCFSQSREDTVCGSEILKAFISICKNNNKCKPRY